MNDTLRPEDIPSIEWHTEARRAIYRLRPTLHRWWARRPSTYARAAVYKALSQKGDQGPDFLRKLCTSPLDAEAVDVATRNVLKRHANELSQEIGETIHPEDIAEGRLPRPRVLDQFSGSGTIPLEALRLGCQAVSVDLNPIAYLIQLCGLRYPQAFGEETASAVGSGPDGTWAGLGQEVKVWGRWIQERVRREVKELYSLLSCPSVDSLDNALTPEVYLWARTVECSNPDCRATIPLVRQPWMVKGTDRSIALRAVVDADGGSVYYVAVERRDGEPLGFDPEPTISRGVAHCPVCGQRSPRDYIREEGKRGGLGMQALAAISRDKEGNRVYVDGKKASTGVPANEELDRRIQDLCQETGLTIPDEPVTGAWMNSLPDHGFSRYSDLFTPRQLLTLMTYVKYIPRAHGQMLSQRYETQRAKAVTTYLALALDKLVEWNSSLCTWNPRIERVMPSYARLSLFLAWDFSEINPFGHPSAYLNQVKQVVSAIEKRAGSGLPAEVFCESATDLPFDDESFDAVVTDPPYYDNVAYADLSDFFYVWLKRSVGHLYPDAFASAVTPKAEEVIADPERHEGNREAAQAAYEEMMEDALVEAARILKRGKLLAIFTYSRDAEQLQAFLRLAREARLELFDAKKIQPECPDTRTRSYPLLLTFRKIELKRESSGVGADAEAVLSLVDREQPPLYEGLASLIEDRTRDDILDTLIPDQYAGSLSVRLREYIADCEDPRGVLRDLLGLPGVVEAAEEIMIGEADAGHERMPAYDCVLRSFGFTVPAPPSDGAVAALETIRQHLGSFRQARDKIGLLGPLDDGMNVVEKVLRDAAWAWGYALLGENRKKHFGEMVDNPLDRLSMGDIVDIYCTLPYYVVDEAGQQFIDRAIALFGKPHPYTPKKYKRYLSDEIVAFRNRVEHNKDNYLDTTSLVDMRQDFIAILQLAQEKLQELLDDGALPLVVRPVRMTVDMYGRRSAELQVEDGTTREIYVTQAVHLGNDYFFFPPQGNPRPVDPPMLRRSEVFGNRD